VLTIGISVCVSALWKGEWPERVTAAAFLLGWAATIAATDYSYENPQWAVFCIDIVALIIAVWVALSSGKNWALWVAGFRLLEVVTHGARMLDPTVGAWAYITATGIWGYLTLGALALGTWECVRRRRAARRLAAQS
jgi:hypothetical protein